ncbi:MAG: hypothetical protein RR842_00575 [Gordonibacter sp.]|uniref:hypothetical protein n=1 Tax=Gordonibacter sp. TaxID=1968902 RepID=UPI002FC9A71D
MDIEAVKTLVTLAQVLWYVLAALLVVAAVALLAHAKVRYVLVTVAFSCAAILSFTWIVAVRAADSFALGGMVDAVGPWIVLVVARVVEPTVWPWVALACSICGIVFGVRNARRLKRQQATVAE